MVSTAAKCLMHFIVNLPDTSVFNEPSRKYKGALSSQ